MNQDWDEVEALRASLREHMAEIKRLNECLTWEQHRAEHVGTHGPGCAMWGPKHYECLLRAHKALKARIERNADAGKTSDHIPDATKMVASVREDRTVEPVGYFSLNSYGNWEQNESGYGTPLYAAPPKREPLTDEEIIKVIETVADSRFAGPLVDLVRAVERAHGIGGK